MQVITKIVQTSLLTAAIVLASCSKSESEAPEQSAADAPAWVLAVAPSDAVSIVEAKSTVKEGDHVVLRGRIGGRKEPLTSGSPVFTVMDLEIPHCGENALDACRTPWDYCCETPETITTNSATVQVVDELGQPISDDLKAFGIEALDEIIVVGTVAPRANEEVLTVRATGIHRVGG